MYEDSEKRHTSALNRSSHKYIFSRQNLTILITDKPLSTVVYLLHCLLLSVNIHGSFHCKQGLLLENIILIADADCSTLDDPRNGQVVLTGVVVYATASYSCNKGFVLVGDVSRRCGCDGRWSGSAPICKRKQYSK